MVIPRSLREEAGVSEGALLKVAVISGGQFLITPQLSIDRPAIGRRASRKQLLEQLSAVVDELRREAKEKRIDKMPKAEISAAVASARKALPRRAVNDPPNDPGRNRHQRPGLRRPT